MSLFQCTKCGCKENTALLHETDDMVNLCCKCYILCLNESYTALRTAADRLAETLAAVSEFGLDDYQDSEPTSALYRRIDAALAAYRASRGEKP